LAQVISQVDAIENQALEEVEGLWRFDADVRFGFATFPLYPTSRRRSGHRWTAVVWAATNKSLAKS